MGLLCENTIKVFKDLAEYYTDYREETKRCLRIIEFNPTFTKVEIFDLTFKELCKNSFISDALIVSGTPGIFRSHLKGIVNKGFDVAYMQTTEGTFYTNDDLTTLINKTVAEKLTTNIDKLLKTLQNTKDNIPAKIDFATVGLFKDNYQKRFEKVFYGNNPFGLAEKLNKNKLTFLKYSQVIDMLVDLINEYLQKTELQDKEMDLFKANYLDIENKRKELEAEHKTMLNEIFTQKDEFVKIKEAEVENLKKEIVSKEDFIQQSQDALSDLTKKYALLIEENEFLGSEKEKQKSAAVDAQTEIDKLKEKNAELKEEAEKNKNEADTLNQELAKQSEEISKIKDLNKKKATEIERQNQEIIKLKEQIKALEETQQKQVKEIEQVNQENVNLKTQNDNLKQSAEEAINTSRQEIDGLSAILYGKERNLSDSEVSFSKALEDVERLIVNNENAKKKHAELKTELYSYIDKFKALNASLRKVTENMIQETKLEINFMKNKMLEITNELKKHKEDNIEYQGIINTLEQTAKTLESKKESAELQKEGYLKKCVEYEQRIEEQNKRLEERETEYLNLHAERKILSAAVKSDRRKLADLEKNAAEQKQKIAELEEAQRVLKRKYEDELKECQAYTKEQSLMLWSYSDKIKKLEPETANFKKELFNLSQQFVKLHESLQVTLWTYSVYVSVCHKHFVRYIADIETKTQEERDKKVAELLQFIKDKLKEKEPELDKIITGFEETSAKCQEIIKYN